MTTCGATRLLVPAAIVGMAVATVTASDGYGWLAAILTGVVLYAVPALRGAGGSCPVPPPSQDAHDVADDADVSGRHPSGTV